MYVRFGFCLYAQKGRYRMRKNYSREDIIKLVEEEDVEFIRLQFTDIFGNLKNVAVTAGQLAKALDHECTFDASSIEGFAGVEESDMYLHPDYGTLEIFPWRPQQGKVARLICDVYCPDGRPFTGDPRFVLKRALAEAEEMGLTFRAGAECEFFLFHLDENGMPTTLSHENAGYFDVGPVDFGENARRDMVLTLEDMGFVVEASHHDVAPAQHEISFQYDEALATADNIMTFKLAVKSIARRHGLHATFMPKPKSGVNGSGMHINMSLFRDGKNLFAGKSGEAGLTNEASWFLGGVLRHIRGMTAITNPIVNSYKRLVPGFEAPVCLSWSENNRSTLIRIPASGGSGARMELRSPDPSANPYLVLAAVLRAGLDGIKNMTDPPASVKGNLFHMSEKERREIGMEALPGTLMEAVSCMEQDDFMKQTLGEHVFERYIALKKEEWDRYRRQVTDWEINEYLNQY